MIPDRHRFLVALALVAATLGVGTIAAIAAPDAASASAAGRVAAAVAPGDVESPEPSPGSEAEPPADNEEAEPSPDPSPEPSPEPGPPPEEEEGGPDNGDGSEAEECGVTDYACTVRNAFNGWLVDIVTDVVNDHMMAIAAGLVLNPHPTEGITNANQAALAVVNAAFVLVVVIGGVLMMTHQTVHTLGGVKDLAPKVVLGWVGANASIFLCRLMTDVGNGIATSLVGSAATPEHVAEAIARVLTNPRGETLVVLLLFVVAALLHIFVIAAMVARIMLWLLLTAAAPIALACHALPPLEGLARLWWRAMGALLAAQIGQALVMRICVTVFLSREGVSMFDPEGAAGSLIDVIVLICCMYVLVRIPFWAFKSIANYQRSPVAKGLKLALSLIVGNHFAKSASAASKTATSRTSAPRPDRPRGPSSWPSGGGNGNRPPSGRGDGGQGPRAPGGGGRPGPQPRGGGRWRDLWGRRWGRSRTGRGASTGSGASGDSASGQAWASPGGTRGSGRGPQSGRGDSPRGRPRQSDTPPPPPPPGGRQWPGGVTQHRPAPQSPHHFSQKESMRPQTRIDPPGDGRGRGDAGRSGGRR